MARKYEHKPSLSNHLKNLFRPRKYDSPLKRSLSGYEMEMCVIDGNGDVVVDASWLLREMKKIDPEFPIKKEPGKNMVEVTALPHSRIQRTALYLIDNIRRVSAVAEEKNWYLLPLGTYPGKFKAKIHSNSRYRYQEKVLGEEKFRKYTTRAYGFHYHYTLPKGVFNEKEKFLNRQSYSRIKQTLIDSYNFLIAADPVLAAFTQSSPFVEGFHHGKDSRMVVWRGGEHLGFDEAAMAGVPNLAGLQPYQQTVSDLIASLEKRDEEFKQMLRDANVPKSFIDKKPKLDYIWHPVKINKAGTLEKRSMDTNYLEICLGVSVMMKFILRAIQQEFYHVMPSDIGTEEPFKLEGNVIFIPPQTVVRERWQPLSAYKGLADNEMYEACRRFYNLARKLVYKVYLPTLDPIKEILDKRRTVSDIIIDYVKRKGHDMETPLSQELARQVALLHSERFLKNIEKTRKNYEGLI